MSKLDELIKELCPDGVDFVRLDSVCKFVNGFAFKSNKFTDEGTPVLRITNIKDGYVDGSELKYANQSNYKEDLSNYTVSRDEIVVAMSGATTGKIGINNSEMVYYLNQRVGKFIPDTELIDNHYLYHFLLTKSEYFYYSAGGGAQPNLSAKTINALQIPLPDLPIQREIVRILDSFEQYNNTLKSELDARKKQYEYYQSVLLKNNNAQIHKLRDICTIIKGKTPIQKAVEGEYPLVVTTSARKSCNTYQFEEASVCVPLVSSRGHGVASLNHVYYQEGKFALGNILCAITPIDKNVVNAKYLYYYLEYVKDYKLVPLMKGGANVSMHIPDIEKVVVSIPTISEQERIVSILDRFDKLCNDISEGIPAEIEARQKQYEYYRDKLLTFDIHS